MARKSTPGMWVVVHDLHCPEWDMISVKAMMDFVRKNSSTIVGFIQAGDAFDNACISHWNVNRPLMRTPGAYLRDRSLFERYYLTPLEEALSKNCTKVWIDGNHERFEKDFVETHPEMQGAISHFEALGMPDRGWEHIELGHTYELGSLSVIHGEVLSGVGNQVSGQPAKKAVELYGCNVLAGHTHSPQSFTKISPVDFKKKFMGWIAPVLAHCNPLYIRNRPTAWASGFTIVEVHPNGKTFNLFPVIITEGRFSYGGKLYGRKS